MCARTVCVFNKWTTWLKKCLMLIDGRVWCICLRIRVNHIVWCLWQWLLLLGCFIEALLKWLNHSKVIYSSSNICGFTCFCQMKPQRRPLPFARSHQGGTECNCVQVLLLHLQHKWGMQWCNKELTNSVWIMLCYFLWNRILWGVEQENGRNTGDFQK